MRQDERTCSIRLHDEREFVVVAKEAGVIVAVGFFGADEPEHPSLDLALAAAEEFAAAQV